MLESRIVTYPRACSSMHMTLCKLVYMLASKTALALAIASMLPDCKSSCLCPVGKVLLGEEGRRAATSRDLPGTCLSPGPVILSCFLPGTKAVAGDNPPSLCGPWGVLSHLPVHGSKHLPCGSGLELAQGGPGLAAGQGWKWNLL